MFGTSRYEAQFLDDVNEALSHDEVVFIKWDIEMEGAQRGGLSILLWLSQDQKSI